MPRPNCLRALALVIALLVLPLADAAAQAGGKGAGDPKGLVPPPKAWAAQVSPTEFTLVWGGVTGATGFEVLVRNVQGKLVRLGLLSASGSRFIVSLTRLSALGITLDQLQFAVRALSGAVEGPLTMFNPVSTAKQSAAKAQVAPANVVARETAPGIVTVTWDGVEGATAYAIGRAVGTSGFQRFCDLCPTSGILVDTVPTAGTQYAYSITAITPTGRSRAISTGRIEVSGLATGADGEVVAGSGPRLDPKTAVEGVTITARPLHTRLIQVLVGFATQQGGVTGELVRKLCNGTEQVIRRFDTLVPIDIQDEIGGTNFPECNAVEKQQVRYLVRIRDAKGLAAQSKEAVAEVAVATSADTAAGASTADPKGLAAGITVTPRSSCAMDIRCIPRIIVRVVTQVMSGPLPNMAAQLMRQVCGQPWAPIRTVALTQTVFELEDVVGDIDAHCGNGKRLVRYAVRVSDPKGLAADSKAGEVELPALESAATEPPPTPGNRSLARVSDGRRILTWSVAPGATSYRIERIAGAKSAWTVAQELPGTATTWTDTARVDGTPQYRITAVNRAGNSATGNFP